MQAAAGAGALILVALAAVHVYWAAGGLWPGSDARDLARTVVGKEPMAPPAACVAVAVALLAAAYLVAAAGQLLPAPLPRVWAQRGGVAVAAVFALRGAAGLFAVRLQPEVAGTPFEYLNRTLYNPLCFAVAALCAFAAGLP